VLGLLLGCVGCFITLPECVVGDGATDCYLPGTCDCLAACEREHRLYGEVNFCYNVSLPRSWEELLAAPTYTYVWQRPLLEGAGNAPESNARWKTFGAVTPHPNDAIIAGNCTGHGFQRVSESEPRCSCFERYTWSSGAATTCDLEVSPPGCLGPPCAQCEDGVCLRYERSEGVRGAVRPFVYVYNLPPGFNALRQHGRGTDDGDPAYSWWRWLGNSPHLTTDASEADYFFLPVTPFARPTMSHGALLLALRHVMETQPYFNASAGRDHLLMCPWDFGCTWIAGYPGFQNVRYLTLWGMKVRDKRYSSSCELCGVPYTPGKDVVIPDWKENDFKATPHHDSLRSVLLFFWGTTTSEVRAAVFRQPWRDAPGVLVGGDKPDGPHLRPLDVEMDAARFCLVLPGAGYTTRGTLAILRGCIPVLVGDNIAQPFHTVLDYSHFSISVPESDLPRMMDILAAVSFEEERRMRGALRAVARHFFWNETDPFSAYGTTMQALAKMLLT